MRLEENHPRRIAAQNAIAHRTARNSWRKAATSELQQLDPALSQREPFKQAITPPWNCEVRTWEVKPKLPNGVSRSSDPETKVAAAIAAINSTNASHVIYTDGSAKDGCSDGGSEALITTGPASAPNIITTIKKKGRKLTSSFEEEREALLAAVEWLNINKPPSPVLICSDSQSALTALDSNSPEMSDIRAGLDTSETRVILQWIPGHSEIPGNEAVDKEAKAATNMDSDDTDIPISFSSAKALIMRTIKDPPHNHQRTREVYGNRSPKISNNLSRKDEVLLAQLRSGHCYLLKAYRRIVDESVDPTCPHCQEAPQTLEHWLQQCPGQARLRLSIFGCVDPPLSVLRDKPEEVILLARRSL